MKKAISKTDGFGARRPPSSLNKGCTSRTTKLHNNFLTEQFPPMFLNIKSKIMKQTQKYRQLSLFDNLTEGGVNL